MGNSEVTLRVSPPGAGKLGQCCSGPYATGSPDSRLLLAGALDTGWDLGQRARLLGLDRSGWGALLLHGRRGRAAGAGTDSGHRSLQESLQARTRWGAQASVVTRWCVPDVREAGSGTFHKDFSAATCAQHQLEGGPTLVEKRCTRRARLPSEASMWRRSRSRRCCGRAPGCRSCSFGATARCAPARRWWCPKRR